MSNFSFLVISVLAQSNLSGLLRAGFVDFYTWLLTLDYELI